MKIVITDKQEIKWFQNIIGVLNKFERSYNLKETGIARNFLHIREVIETADPEFLSITMELENEQPAPLYLISVEYSNEYVNLSVKWLHEDVFFIERKSIKSPKIKKEVCLTDIYNRGKKISKI